MGRQRTVKDCVPWRELDAFREGNYVPIINEYC
jgi:hypothetical protein